MKEFIIVFVVALAISSLFNGWNPFVSAPTDETVVHQTATSDNNEQQSSANQAAQQQASPSGSPTTPNGSTL